MSRLSFRGTPLRAREAIIEVAESAVGRRNPEAAEGVYLAVGIAALSDVHQAFIDKSQGKTGEDGITWAPLSPETLAYGRRAPKGGGLAPGGKDGLLTQSQLDRWYEVYSQQLARFAASEGLRAAKGHAAAIAWSVVKSEGGRTKLSEYGNRPHEIGRDTGVLLNSLSPGAVGRARGQVFERSPGLIVVGTNVPYASHFARRRPIIPEQVPRRWVERWAKTAADALSIAFRRALTGA